MLMSITQANALNDICRHAEKLAFQKTGLRVRLEIRGIEDERPPIELIKCIGEHFAVTIEELESDSKARSLSWVRFVCYLMLKEHYEGITLEEIAKMFKRHHTSVVQGLQSAKNLLDTKDRAFTTMYNQTKTLCNTWLTN